MHEVGPVHDAEPHGVRGQGGAVDVEVGADGASFGVSFRPGCSGRRQWDQELIAMMKFFLLRMSRTLQWHRP